MDALAIFNSFEAVFWIVTGGIVWRQTRATSGVRQLGGWAAFWFVLFGISDIFEVFTGAWYRPLALLVFKGVCLTALVACGVMARKRRR